MCGIVDIADIIPASQPIYDALTMPQHRGQDAANVITIDVNSCFRSCRVNGLVNDVFEACYIQRLQGNMGTGHMCYPAVGSSDVSEA